MIQSQHCHKVTTSACDDKSVLGRVRVLHPRIQHKANAAEGVGNSARHTPQLTRLRQALNQRQSDGQPSLAHQ